MSYDHLLGILKNNRELYQIQKSQVPTTCPNDSTVLQKGPNGDLHCPFDGWIWDGTPGIDA